MKTTIDHLPDDQQQKLQAITAVFTSPDVTIPVDMLIPFGSRARGDWVDDQKRVIGVTTTCWLSSRTRSK